MCLFAAISSSFGVLVACGPSSKVIAMYGPSTFTSEKVIFSAIRLLSDGPGGVAVLSCALISLGKTRRSAITKTEKRITLVGCTGITDFIGANHFTCLTRPYHHASKLVGDRPVEPAALTKLRREHPDAAATAQFVNFVEQVHNIETDLESRLFRDLDAARQIDVECLVRPELLSIGKTLAQAIAIKSVNSRSPVLPRVGN